MQASASGEPTLIDELNNGDTLDDVDGVISLLTVGGDTEPYDVMLSQGRCNFATRGDYVHRSSSGFAASGHGWWVNYNCPVSYAQVKIQLQQYYSDGVWRNKGPEGKARVTSGGGAGRRATGRVNCATTFTTGWRSVIDFDLVGYPDSPEKLVTYERNISCRV